VHSCRNRACPRCGAGARAEWLEARAAELLPVPYFHVVFTVPEELNVLALYAPRVFYDLLFRAAAQTLTDIARSRLHLQTGLLSVLHTWSQTLMLHPHIHCVVPGGGFSEDRARWIGVRKPAFFLPVKVLSRRFRTLLCSGLREAWSAGRLTIPARVIADAVALDLLLARASRQDWVVYSKAPFGGPAQVLRYLGNYTHRIAISNSRILAFERERVTFRYRDSRTGQTDKTMTLEAAEFLRRFLLHVLPVRLVRIRYYGFMANRLRAGSIARARTLIGQRDLSLPSPSTQPDPNRCPHCHEGTMRVIGPVEPHLLPPWYEDSS
jgi:Putative transposase/Transposase zinc-binding domain